MGDQYQVIGTADTTTSSASETNLTSLVTSQGAPGHDFDMPPGPAGPQAVPVQNVQYSQPTPPPPPPQVQQQQPEHFVPLPPQQQQQQPMQYQIVVQQPQQQQQLPEINPNYGTNTQMVHGTNQMAPQQQIYHQQQQYVMVPQTQHVIVRHPNPAPTPSPAPQPQHYQIRSPTRLYRIQSPHHQVRPGQRQQHYHNFQPNYPQQHPPRPQQRIVMLTKGRHEVRPPQVRSQVVHQFHARPQPQVRQVRYQVRQPGPQGYYNHEANQMIRYQQRPPIPEAPQNIPAGPGGPQCHQQNIRLAAPPDPHSSEIAYDVEHVFNENGKEVRKMPIKMGNSTFWVDVVDNKDNVMPEDAVMLNLDDPEPVPGPAPSQAQAQAQTLTTAQSPAAVPSALQPVKPKMTDQVRDQIIKEVTVNLISPSEVSKKVGMSVVAIRNIIKTAGMKLPSKYKVTSTNKAQQVGPVTTASPAPVPKIVTLSGSASGAVVRQVTGGLQLPQKSLPPGQPVLKAVEKPVGPAPAPIVGQDGYKPKLIPGKMALCKNCGAYSNDFNKCVRCKKPIPEDCKVIEDKKSEGPAPKAENLRNVRIMHKPRRKTAPDEPECIALSSDEEADEEESKPEMEESPKTENVDRDEERQHYEDLAKEVEATVASGNKIFTSMNCRSIRIGSYKSMPREKVYITEKAIQLKVPQISNPSELITVTIKKQSILKVLAHFGRSMPLLFIFCTSGECSRIRSLLKMTDKSSGLWFDMSCHDETMKRLTILPDKMTDEMKNAITTLFKNEMRELDAKTANEILVKSSPKDSKVRALQVQQGGSLLIRSKPGASEIDSSRNVKFCQFPPTGSSAVSVTTEDYFCLEDESFLNDVVIDFFFKWLQFHKLNEVDRDRTHIFSTFFYKRLTTRPPKQKNKLHPVEDDLNISPAEKRYERVKRWTKKVNIFDKDFIVVPINEHSHWFVAVICFPGLESCVKFDTDERTPVPETQIKASLAMKNRKKPSGSKRVLQIGSTSIIPIQPGKNILEKIPIDADDSDRDEADADEDDLLVEDDPDESGDAKPEEMVRIKQPCILIFDSLQTGSRAKVAATLRDYLNCEFKAKVPEVKNRKFTKDNMRGCCPKVPQQPNFSDCGIFLLQYIESFFEKPLDDFSLPIRNIRNWFTKDKVKNKRSEIAKLIRDLAAEQHPDKKFNFPNLVFTPESGSGYTDDEDDRSREDLEKDIAPSEVKPGTDVLTLTAAPSAAGGMVIMKKAGGKIDMVPVKPVSGPPGRVMPKILSQDSENKPEDVKMDSGSAQTSPDSTTQALVETVAAAELSKSDPGPDPEPGEEGETQVSSSLQQDPLTGSGQKRSLSPKPEETDSATAEEMETKRPKLDNDEQS